MQCYVFSGYVCFYKHYLIDQINSIEYRMNSVVISIYLGPVRPTQTLHLINGNNSPTQLF